MESFSILFTLDKKLNLDCYDKVDYNVYEYCNTADSVCTTEMKLVKSTNIISSLYAEARFERVLLLII